MCVFMEETVTVGRLPDAYLWGPGEELLQLRAPDVRFQGVVTSIGPEGIRV